MVREKGERRLCREHPPAPLRHAQHGDARLQRRRPSGHRRAGRAGGGGNVPVHQRRQGRIHPEKGIEIAINAIKKLDIKWPLKIIGPHRIDQGGGGKHYLNKLKEISKNYPIKFCKPIFKSKLLEKEYAKASIFLYPSIAEKGETFGLAPLEAMSYGAVPIVSDLDCFKDFIKNNKNGLIFNHNNKPEITLAKKIMSLQNSITLRQKLSKQAFKVNKSHSIEKICNLFIADFKKIIKNNKIII